MEQEEFYQNEEEKEELRNELISIIEPFKKQADDDDSLKQTIQQIEQSLPVLDSLNPSKMEVELNLDFEENEVQNFPQLKLPEQVQSKPR